MAMYSSIGLVHIMLVVRSLGRLRAIHHVLLLSLQIRKRAVHAEYATTNRCPVQEILHGVSPTPRAESHPRCFDSAGPDRSRPACHRGYRKTAQTRDKLSPCTFRGSAGWREFPPTV